MYCKAALEISSVPARMYFMSITSNSIYFLRMCNAIIQVFAFHAREHHRRITFACFLNNEQEPILHNNYIDVFTDWTAVRVRQKSTYQFCWVKKQTEVNGSRTRDSGYNRVKSQTSQETINASQSVQIPEQDIYVLCLHNVRYKAAYEQEYRGWEGIDSTVNTEGERHVD